ncbi:hypothetical protein NN6n1_18910 [Shinella zoogloeoides]
MGKARHTGSGLCGTLERPMLIVLPALALLISGMFVLTTLAALSGGRDEEAAARRRVF